MINLLTLEPGTTIRLNGGVTAEVVSNPKDGMWVRVRYLSAPDNPDLVHTEELVFAEDVLDLA